MNMPVSVVTSGGLPVQLSANGQGLPLQLATVGALPVTIVTSGGVPCLDPLGNVFTSLPAPVLTLLSAASDNTPLWGFELTSPLEDDVIRIEWDDAIPYATQVSFADYTLTAGDLAGDFEFDFGLSAFADGPWSWRAYHRRGASSSAVSNEVTLTIATASRKATYPYLMFG